MSIKMKEIRPNGFTLLEVVVAFGLLFVFFIAITSLELSSFRGVSYLMKNQAAGYVADTQINILRAHGIDNNDPPPAESTGTMTIGSVPYNWDMKLMNEGDAKRPGLQNYRKRVTVEVTWAADEGAGRMLRESIVVFPAVADPLPTPTPTPTPTPSIPPPTP